MINQNTKLEEPIMVSPQEWLIKTNVMLDSLKDENFLMMVNICWIFCFESKVY